MNLYILTYNKTHDLEGSMMTNFDHIESLVFDLDNTLYPAECDLFSQIDIRMGEFISQELGLDMGEARKLQKQYYYDHGTTLNGLMTCHDMAPEPYLEYVHDIDLSPVATNPELGQILSQISQPKYVYTNGSTAHAEAVLKQIGIDELFDDIFDIKAAGFTPKPDQTAYEKFISYIGLRADTSVIFEDLERNLIAPHNLGMTTVWINSPHFGEQGSPNKKRPSESLDHVHHETRDLTEFLKTVRL